MSAHEHASEASTGTILQEAKDDRRIEEEISSAISEIVENCVDKAVESCVYPGKTLIQSSLNGGFLSFG
jgi:hypothetical protein